MTTIKYSHWYFKMPWMKKYEGAVFGRTILFRDAKEQVSKALLEHEMVHQRQMDTHGVFGFYVKYLWYYLKGLVQYRSHRLAYLKHPFEKEAYGR
jgi:hypothetical protein